MNELKVGGSSNASKNEPPLIEVTPMEKPSEPVTSVEPTESVTPSEPTEPVTPTEPVEPIGGTNKENNSVNTTPVVDTEDDKSSLRNTEPTQPLEITNDILLKSLSEKLGREVKDFSELNQKTVEVDPSIQEIMDWKEKTGRPVTDWIKYQKDYTQMDDVSVARELLRHEYPNATEGEISLEMKKFISTEEDLDDEITAKNWELKKYATKGRQVLGELVSKFGEPVEGTTRLSDEMIQDLDFAKKVKEQSVQNQQLIQEYSQNIQKVSSETEKIDLELSDDLTISFKVSDETKSSLPSMISEMPHWRNEDGSWNHQNIVNDGIVIKHFKDIVRLAYEQGMNAGKEDLSRGANNVTLNQTVAASQSQDKKGIQIEGLDMFMGRDNLKIGR